ncbi:MAG: PD-(D/E)XK nuclease family protein, partial [Kiritimatiellae bacterium]|nr:PD-(D/E)XK nuclease family protein [Kiritimatiellia bacterium]
MPTLNRHFIGTDNATPELIVRWCQQQWPTHLPSGLLFCVPTSLAMRRLRDALTRAYHAFHGVRFTLPAGLVTYFMSRTMSDIATPTEQLSAWDKVFDWLQTEDAQNLVATWLFPGEKAWLSRPAARYAIAQRFITLRATLAEAVLDFTSTAQHPQTQLLESRERNRWAALEALEAKYRETLSTAGLVDPTDVQLACFQNPTPQSIESQADWRLIVACVPDIMPALSKLFEAAPVCDILIQAEEANADAFTNIGAPAPAYWQHTPLHLPDTAIQIAENPADEAHCIEHFLTQSGSLNPADICLGVLNHEVMPTLTSTFATHDIQIFEPDPIRLTDQPAVRLLQTLFQLHQESRIDFIRPLLSSSEVTNLFDTSYTQLRTDYNELIEQHQPTTLQDALQFTPEDAPLHALLMKIQQWLHQIHADPSEGSRAILTELFGAAHADPVKHAILFSTLETLQQLFQEISTIRLPDTQPSIALLDARLRQITLHPIRGASDCSYEGRLEILWSSAKVFVFSGLNEGLFPDTTFEDAFLPNHFRTQLGLRADHTRIARDAYLLETLCKRIPERNILLICSRINQGGEWLKPSRLFFQCTPEQRKARVQKLFLEAPTKTVPLGATSAIKLTSALDTWAEQPQIKRLSASAIRTFLTAPIDFWIQYVLKLKDTSPLPSGVPENLFGTLIHSTLEQLPKVKSADPTEIEAFLVATFTELFAQQYGTSPNTELLAVRRAGIKRLQSAAQCEAESRLQGWETHYIEGNTRNTSWEVTLDVDGRPITLYGKIDRIDYNASTGTWRIID